MKKKKNIPDPDGENRVDHPVSQNEPSGPEQMHAAQETPISPEKQDEEKSSVSDKMKQHTPKGLALWNAAKSFLKDFRVLTALCGTAAVVLALWISIAVWLPAAAERTITDVVSVISGLKQVELKVVAIYPRTARLSCILRDESGHTVMTCDDVRLRYSPWNVRSGKIRRIVFRNAVFYAKNDFSSLIRRWLEIRETVPGNLSVGRVVFEEAELAAEPYDRTVFSAAFEPGIQSGWGKPHGETHTSDHGDSAFAWKLNGDYDLKEKNLSLFGKIQFPAAALSAVQKINLTNVPFGKMLTDSRKDGTASVSFRVLKMQCPAEDPVSALKNLEMDFSFRSSSLNLTDGYAA